MTYRTALIPPRHSAHGPVTTARRRRTAALYAALFLVGTALAVFGGSPNMTALGLGLLVPGGGFLSYAAGDPLQVSTHVGMALGTMSLFGGALVAWFGSGNVVGLVAVWLGSAAWAAGMTHCETWPQAVIVVPSVIAMGACLQWLIARQQFRRALNRRSARNDFLQATHAVETPTSAVDGLPLVDELSREDVSAMRFLFDRALQPVDEFNGYSWIEQFQTSSMRYQLMMTSYVLSLTQSTRLPAFRGYLSTAQRNLIEKTKLPRVWSYWKYENAFGNLRLGADPMAPDTHDNVMYSGWFAAMVGMYASNTGDDRYSAPGSITLCGPRDRKYVYDWPAVVRILADNFERSSFTLFPCEPNWIYPLCNTYAGIGLRIHDRLRGTNYWERLESDYRKGLEEEFTNADGRMVVIRSSHTGLSVPGLTSVMTDAGVSMFLHGLLPDVARRTWEILRHDLMSLVDGHLDVHYHGSDFLDVGNYAFSRGGTLACVANLAAEMGDAEVVKAALQLIESKYPAVTEGGTTRYPGLSVNSHLLAFAGRANRANGMHDLVTRGMPQAWQQGPVLEEAAYPHVLVAKAVSDGQALELVVYPGHQPGRRRIGLCQLQPGRHYRCQGAVDANMIGDELGRAAIELDLEGRTALRVTPVL